jgi:O-antigen ligase
MAKKKPITNRLIEMFDRIPYEEPITSPRKKDDEIAGKSELKPTETNVDVQDSASGESEEVEPSDLGAMKDNDVVIHLLAAGATVQSPGRLTSVLKFIVVMYLLGMVALSVEQFLTLPQNLSLVDFWNMFFLPVCWLYLIRIRQTIRFPFALGMWFILLGSFFGTFISTNPLVSIIFIAKEIYLYIWFITLTAVFTSFEPGLIRRVLLVWTAVVALHGVLLVAEFVSPNFYLFMISFLGRFGTVDTRYFPRATGLFQNPVWAALFELMGFVPLLLGGLRRELSLLLGLVLLLSILATASLGALTSLLGALVVALILLLLMGGHLKFFVWFAAVVTLAAGMFLFTLSQSPVVQTSLEHLTTDRAAHTADERLFLWGGGTNILFSPQSILGVGPNNYRDFLENKTLHNDFLEFGVERGVIGLLGLALLAGEALNSAVKILLNQIKSGDTARPSGVIFLAMLFGVLLESNAHQIFHFRSVWLGLALLETTLFRMKSPSIEAAAKRVVLWGARLQSPGKSSPLKDRFGPSSVEAE